MYHQQHNTDTMFNKLGSYYKNGYGWLKRALDFKADVKDNWQRIDKIKQVTGEDTRKPLRSIDKMYIEMLKASGDKTYQEYYKQTKAKTDEGDQNGDANTPSAVGITSLAIETALMPFDSSSNVFLKEYSSEHVPFFADLSYIIVYNYSDLITRIRKVSPDIVLYNYNVASLKLTPTSVDRKATAIKREDWIKVFGQTAYNILLDKIEEIKKKNNGTGSDDTKIIEKALNIAKSAFNQSIRPYLNSEYFTQLDNFELILITDEEDILDYCEKRMPTFKKRFEHGEINVLLGGSPDEEFLHYGLKSLYWRAIFTSDNLYKLKNIIKNKYAAPNTKDALGKIKEAALASALLPFDHPYTPVIGIYKTPVQKQILSFNFVLVADNNISNYISKTFGDTADLMLVDANIGIKGKAQDVYILPAEQWTGLFGKDTFDNYREKARFIYHKIENMQI